MAGGAEPGAVYPTRKPPREGDQRLWAWCCLKGPAGISEIRSLTSFVHSLEVNTLIFINFFLLTAYLITEYRKGKFDVFVIILSLFECFFQI